MTTVQMMMAATRTESRRIGVESWRILSSGAGRKGTGWWEDGATGLADTWNTQKHRVRLVRGWSLCSSSRSRLEEEKRRTEVLEEAKAWWSSVLSGRGPSLTWRLRPGQERETRVRFAWRWRGRGTLTVQLRGRDGQGPETTRTSRPLARWCWRVWEPGWTMKVQPQEQGAAPGSWTGREGTAWSGSGAGLKVVVQAWSEQGREATLGPWQVSSCSWSETAEQKRSLVSSPRPQEREVEQEDQGLHGSQPEGDVDPAERTLNV